MWESNWQFWVIHHEKNCFIIYQILPSINKTCRSTPWRGGKEHLGGKRKSVHERHMLSFCSFSCLVFQWICSTFHFKLASISGRRATCWALPSCRFVAPVLLRWTLRDRHPQPRGRVSTATLWRERGDNSGGSSARLFLIGDRLLRWIGLKKRPQAPF